MRPTLARECAAWYPQAVLAGFLGLAAWWGMAIPEPAAQVQTEDRNATRPASYLLHWSAPPECPDAEVIRGIVVSAVGELEGGLGVLDVEATVEQRDSTFALVLETTHFERHDVRTIESPRCMDLAESVALVVAIALNPSLGPEEPPASTGAEHFALAPEPPEPPERNSTQPQPVPRPVPEPSEPPPKSSAASRPRAAAPHELILRVAAQFEYGRLPPWGGGAEIGVGVAWPRWRLEAYGSYLWPRRSAGPQGTGGLYQFGAAGLRACRRLWAGKVEFPLCLGIEGGGLQVESRGIEPQARIRGRWLAPTAAAGVAVGRGRVFFWSLLEAAPVVLGSRFSVGGDVVFEPEPVAARLLAGLELRFAIESWGRGHGAL